MLWLMLTFLTTATCWYHKSKCHSWFRSLHNTGLGKSVPHSKITTWDDDNFNTGKCGLKHRFKLCLNCTTGIQSSQLPHVKIDALIHFLACFSCVLFLNCVVLNSEKNVLFHSWGWCSFGCSGWYMPNMRWSSYYPKSCIPYQKQTGYSFV